MSVPPKVPEKEPRYKIVELKLTGKPPRQIVFDFTADYFALIESSPDLNTDNVRIAFNEPNNYIPLSKATLVRAPLSVLKSVWVDWDPSENGKYVKFYYSGAPFLEIAANVITLGADFIGVAKEGTLQQIKQNLDKFQFTPDGLLKVTATTAVVTNIDVPLSTRASETTVSAISSKLDRFQFTPDGLLKVTAVSAEIPNIDVALSTRASEATVSAIKSQTDKLTFDSSNNLKVNASVVANPPNLDVALSTRASETTLSAIKSQTDKLTFDTNNNLNVNARVVSNPPNLDVSLSTINNKFPGALTLTDTLSNPTTTIIGAANLGFDGTYWRRLVTDTSGRLRVSADVVTNPPNLDVALSTRASETTLSGIKSQTDKLTFDTSGNLKVNASVVANPPNLDVTLSSFSNKFPSATALADNLQNPTTTIIGAANLGFDGTYWRRLVTDTSGRLRTVVESIANPPNLDVALSTRASETTLSAIKSKTDLLSFDSLNNLKVNVTTTVNPPNLDIALSTRASESTLSAIAGALASKATDKLRVSVVDSLPRSNFTVVDSTGTELSSYIKNLDTTLSTRASESTLSGIKAKTDLLTFDANNYLQVNVKSIVNPSNLDVAISTRASESTLSSFSNKFPSATALADNLSNPTTTIIGVANLGFDGTYWRRLVADTSGRLRTVVESIANPPNLDVALSTIHYPVYSQTIGVDETIAQSITLDTRGKILLEVYAKADALTTFHLDVSTDNTNWISDYKTYTGTLVQDTLWNGFRYVRLRSDAAGVSGNKVTLILSAK